MWFCLCEEIKVARMKISASVAVCMLLGRMCPWSEAFSTNMRAVNKMPFVGKSSTGLNAYENPSESVFLTAESAKECIAVAGGSPCYAYSREVLEKNADLCLAFPSAYGLTVRYAMKACPNGSILKIFDKKGIHIDASSGFEVRRAIEAGIPADHISLSTQELPADFADLIDLGIKVNAW